MHYELAVWRDDLHQQFYCDGPIMRVADLAAPTIEHPNHLTRSSVRATASVATPIDLKNWMRIVCVDGGHAVEIENRLCRLVKIGSGLTIAENTAAKVALPALFRAHKTLIEIRSGFQLREDDPRLKSIVQSGSPGSATLVPPQLLGQSPSADTLASWFEALSQLQRSSGESQGFFQQAASAVCDPGGLDLGMIVMRRGGELRIEASRVCHPALGITYCHDLVQNALAAGRTLYCDALQDSLQDCGGELPNPIVAAPILAAAGDLVGVVYGARTLRGKNQRFRIRPLEALWVQLVADAVGAALQRAEAEARATRTRVLFEQAFSPEMVDELLRDPQALEGQEREVTVLFCDIRNSTSISGQLGAQLTYRLMGDVLEYFTTRVMETGGVIIDYYGDGLAAMWNAPRLQDDHAQRGCRAALAMQNQLDQLNSMWSSRLNQPLRIGVGVHSDIAQVGNAGTTRRLKYGPRGQMVHLASRLERATRDFRVPILISAATNALVTCNLSTRHIGEAELPGIRKPVELIELCGPKSDELKPTPNINTGDVSRSQ